MRTHYRILPVLFALVVFSGFALPAHADVVVTQTIASPQPGIQIFNSTNPETDIRNNASYLNALYQDIKSHFDSITENPGSVAPTLDQVKGAGIWAGNGEDSYHFVSGPQTTLDRVCTVIDGTFGPAAGAKMTQAGQDSYESEGDNTVILYNGSLWRWQKAKGSSNHHLRNMLTCISYAIPAQTFSASTYSIRAGDPVTLTWNDNFPRDYWSDSSPYPDPQLVVGSTPQGGNDVLGNTNAGDYPNAVCSSENWSNRGLTGGHWESHGERVCLQTGLNGFCTEPDIRIVYSWVSDSVTMGELKSGSVTVYPSQTTTYAYTCASRNGTRTVSATVNVVTPSAPDLVAGSVSPVRVTVGQQAAFSSKVTNSGTAATGGTFKTLFQKANDATGSGAVDMKTVDAPALGANASTTVSVTQTFSTAGTYYLRACADKSSAADSGVITESNEGNNCGAWTAVVVALTGPDLTVGAVGPATATVGMPTALTAVVHNPGDAPVGRSFKTLFQVSSNSYGANAVDVGAADSAALASGATETVGLSYTFGGAGTYYLRACADKSSAADSGVITESDETNNCGAWGTLIAGNPGEETGNPTQPGHPGQPGFPGNPGNPGTPEPGSISALLIVEPVSVVRGFPVHISWSSNGAASCTGDNFATGGAVSGGIDVTPLETTLYTLTCENEAGDKAYDSQRVTVTAPQLSISASPELVRKGDSSTIAWSVKGKVTSCIVSGPGLAASGTSGSRAVAVTAESTYTLSCKAGSFSPSQSVTVKVLPSFGEF